MIGRFGLALHWAVICCILASAFRSTWDHFGGRLALGAGSACWMALSLYIPHGMVCSSQREYEI